MLCKNMYSDTLCSTLLTWKRIWGSIVVLARQRAQLFDNELKSFLQLPVMKEPIVVIMLNKVGQHDIKRSVRILVFEETRINKSGRGQNAERGSSLFRILPS